MELVFFLFVLLVLWPFLKTCFLYCVDHDEWKRARVREHEDRMENKRMATGLFGWLGRLFH